MVRLTIIDTNPLELKYYPFIISLKTFTGSFNTLSPKICVPKETKDINVKALNFNLVTTKDEAKEMTENISRDSKCKFNTNSNQQWNNKTCQCECKSYYKCEKSLHLEF